MACYLSSNATYRSTLQLKFTSGPNHFEEEYAHYEANPDHLKRIRIQLIYVTLFYFNKTINVIFIKSYWRNHSGSGKNILDSEKTFLIRKKHSWFGKNILDPENNILDLEKNILDREKIGVVEPNFFGCSLEPKTFVSAPAPTVMHKSWAF